ncbi:MAG: M28 family metallopeptidase [Candidatus Hodarchaeota archaeon]
MNNIKPLIPTKEEILSWIKIICDKGYRRPGSEGDRKVEDFLVQKLREFGVLDIKKDAIEIPFWEPENWKLIIEMDHEKKEIPCFFIVYTEFTSSEGVSGEIIYLKGGREIDFQKNDVNGKIVAIDFRNPPLQIDPLTKFALYKHDPKNTIPVKYSHPAIFQTLNWDSFYRAYENGAIGVIGILKDLPAEIKEYYYPADNFEHDLRPIPGLYIGRDDGKELKKLFRKNRDKTITGTMALTGKKSQGTTNNILGFILGKTDDTIIISSHHDAPFNNAVQDGSGTGIILALAKYFAQFPQETFDKTLLFLFTGGHFYEEIGGKAFVEKYKNDLLPKIVITIHIEHIGKEYLEKDGKLVATGYPEPRGIFISDNPSLFSLVKDVVIKYDLQRLLIFPTDNPLEVPTDGAPFYWEKLPIISLASAPLYIYNPIDTIEKLAIEEFEPVTKAFIDIIQSIDKLPRKDLRIN